MNNVPMRFKNFEFAINPQKIEIKAVSNLKQIAVPFDAFELQELGIKPLVISGEGELFGKSSNQDFETILRLFLQGGAGELFLSGTEPMLAIMTKLAKGEDSFEDMVSYSFEFVEVPQRQVEQLTFEKHHTIQQGESLWNLSAVYDIPIEELLRLNEKTSNPWAVDVGDVVRVQ